MPVSPNGSGQRPYKASRCGFKSRRGYAAGSHSSVEVAPLLQSGGPRFEPWCEHGDCSSTAERPAVTREEVGSAPTSHPRVCWAVGLAQRSVKPPRRESPWGFESLRTHSHALVAQWKRARLRSGRPEVRVLSGARVVECTSGQGAVCKTAYDASSPASTSMPSTVGLRWRSVGCSTAAHNGGRPGSAPGTATVDGGIAFARTSDVMLLSTVHLRCEDRGYFLPVNWWCEDTSVGWF